MNDSMWATADTVTCIILCVLVIMTKYRGQSINTASYAKNSNSIFTLCFPIESDEYYIRGLPESAYTLLYWVIIMHWQNTLVYKELQATKTEPIVW